MPRRRPRTGPCDTSLSRVEGASGPVLYVSCGTCAQGTPLKRALDEGSCPVCGEPLFIEGLVEGLRATLRVGGPEALEGWARRMRMWRG
jgi:hypothetical protein